ncbi:MAG TPA: 2-oxoglutarate dehydrogenase complex dihydrolipoyllysine-residue succinyltransferase [Chitinophagaceae bacterium]|jgi:2-oxoglutarate dehydrogenase E2 component (dihydrolipoamide succinyltransferase)|nr:2-oxoglutarate dehydrogenase complex dihydrolipoyllysine-residue succinyltransferase [Chitinophagaceae bacterium]
MIEIKVPTVGESINEVTLIKWLKKDGDYVERDEVIAELESEKATFEVNAEQAGVLKTMGHEGDTLNIGQVLAKIDETASRPGGNGTLKKESAKGQPAAQAGKDQETVSKELERKKSEAKIESTKTEKTLPQTATNNQSKGTAMEQEVRATPVASAIIADKKLNPSTISPSGVGGKILKDDVLEALTHPGKRPGIELFSREEKTDKMSNLRKTVSRRLVEAKNTTAMLTTFNEVNMQPIMDIRAKHKEKFKELHGVNLGFMSFFTKAVCYALQEWPAVNSYIDGDSIISHNYCDISIAVSAPKGLVVPIIRNAESLSMADIEKKVVELATKARENKLSLEEMQGGTFTITNGGVFGSLMSTPIINIPQSAILGMHKIEERPVVIDKQIVIRPMMYVALSYDHRIIDGRESVSFLVRVKELLENPGQLLIGKDPVATLLGI